MAASPRGVALSARRQAFSLARVGSHDDDRVDYTVFFVQGKNGSRGSFSSI
jgi:hypothetical protein